MIVFLDTNPVIYFVEQPPVWGPKAAARIAALRAAGEELAVSDLIRMECLVGPLKAGDVARRRDFELFFAEPDIHVFPVSGAACDRAATIRADHGFQQMDCLHLAVAVEHGCGLFLTNDRKLARFPDITVEVLS